MLSAHYHERSFKGTDRKINDPAYSITYTHTRATKTTLCLEPTCLPLQQLLRCQSDSQPDKYVFGVLSLQRNWSNTSFFFFISGYLQQFTEEGTGETLLLRSLIKSCASILTLPLIPKYMQGGQLSSISI